MSRDAVLSRVRASLGRSSGEPAPAPPPLRNSPPPLPREEKLNRFAAALERLGVQFVRVPSLAAVRAEVEARLLGRSALVAPDPFLASCGLQINPTAPNPGSWREACAGLDVGITGAAYALAETGTLVMIAGPENPRLGSLLPPAYIAVIRESQLLDHLPALLAREPKVFDRSSSMVLVTGTSSTGDIEQLLIKGVHGPGEGHVILIEEPAA